ncbi:MAG: hypothetical protein ACR2KV_15270 [Solirubrobacteraceae bacterium]
MRGSTIAAKAGRIPSVRIGGEDGPLRFVAADIDRWLDQARAAWKPGRATVAQPDRPPEPDDTLRRRRPAQAGGHGQQSLL